MDTKFKVVSTGKFHEGLTYQEVVANLVLMTNLDSDKVEKLIGHGKPALIRKDLSLQEASKYQKRLSQAGLIIRVLRQIAVPKKTDHQVAENTSSNLQMERPPVPQKKAQPPQAATQSPENPYSSPKAELRKSTVTEAQWLGEPRKVPASHGWKWLTAACRMFLAKPWKWMGMSIVMIILASIPNLIPIVGPFLYQFIFVVMAGGMLMAAHNQANNLDFGFGHIFRGFTHNRNQLLMISVVYFGIFILIGLVAGLFIGGGFFAFMGGGGFNPDAISTAIENNFIPFALLMCIVSLLFIPIMMAYWFVTPLVALGDEKAWPSFKLSFKGCAKNWLAFLVYGLAILVLSVVAFAVISGAVGLGSTFFSDSFAIMFPLIMLFAIFVGLPAMVISGLTVYTGFRDIFYSEQ